MTRRRFDATRLLSWYPPTWRARYGEEFVLYVEDTLDGARPTPGFLISIAFGAVRERGHQSGLFGARSTPVVQSRAGALVVLCAWSIFMIAGASFSKLSEHFARSMPAGSSSLARVAFDVVVASGALGMVVVFIGALVALPSLVRFLRSGGWNDVRRTVLTVLVLTVLALTAFVALVRWAHDLSVLQRNGGDGGYSLAFVALAVLSALTVASWVRAVVQCVARMELSPHVLRIEARLAVALAVLMATITLGAAIWWIEVGRLAPWFLQGARFGTSSSAFTPNVLITLVLMVIAAGVGAFGVHRIVRSWRIA